MPANAENRLKKLHLGCGRRFIPGFIHVDMGDYPHLDYQCSVDKLPMFDENSVELIYASHVLEYFDLQEAKAVLHEWYTKLSSGAILRLSVPDFDKLLQVYKLTQNIESLMGPLYGRMTCGTNTIHHKMVWNQSLLRRTLLEVGFSEIREWNWRQVEHGHIDDHSQAYFPHMCKENGLMISANLEAVKR